jgi:hypothetical protein
MAELERIRAERAAEVGGPRLTTARNGTLLARRRRGLPPSLD